MAKTKMQPKLLNVNRTPHRPKKRKKITLVFDETKRKEFLQGFRKRKLQRQQRAKEELQKQLKEEKKRIKHEVTYIRYL
ncbi:nucleolar protein 12 [Ceratina calcarata]|uniref:Nucleolar protein 12 n=1 Tax=Ceratina calcarata TaxID=156304 RepID=A0AAJ7S885_9HYME|nr:nucleolar protein 12 [Ceratina calcarata]XP_026673303.1 nucleolar protein 12 [Ceratina calcarata]